MIKLTNRLEDDLAITINGGILGVGAGDSVLLPNEWRRQIPVIEGLDVESAAELKIDSEAVMRSLRAPARLLPRGHLVFLAAARGHKKVSRLSRKKLLELLFGFWEDEDAESPGQKKRNRRRRRA